MTAWKDSRQEGKTPPGLPQVSSLWWEGCGTVVHVSHPTFATKSRKKKIPPESARAGAEDDSMADNTVTNPGTNSTTSMMISTIPENPTPAPGKTLQSCICGWAKVTSSAGLKIHQGKKKCLKEVEQGPRIDQYFLRSRSSQSSEVQRQDENHSPQNISPPVPEEEEESSTAEHPEPSLQHHAAEKKTQERRPPIHPQQHPSIDLQQLEVQASLQQKTHTCTHTLLHLSSASSAPV